MRMKRFVTGPIGTNLYLVYNEETCHAVVIDPAACPQELVDEIRELGLTVDAILLTHAHFDHIMGIDAFLQHFPVPVYVQEEDRCMLEDAVLNHSANYRMSYTYSGSETVKDGDILPLAGYDFQVLHTPGHTPGGCCYYLQAEEVLFSGDTLFQESVGRTDFPKGSMSELVRSIREKLFALPEETMVFPGHMEATTIQHEKQYNPFL